MTLPAFADIADLDARIPAGVSAADDARAQAAIDDASALIRLAAGKDWVTDDELDADVPDIVRTICCRAALRSFVNPAGLNQETTGPYSASYANASSDVYLTKAEEAQVRKAAGFTVVSAISTTRGPLETGRCFDARWGVADEYLPVDPDGKDIPFL